MSSGSILREARLRAGLTQADLADRTGTTQSSVARWEANRSRPTLETLTRLVRACGLDLQTRIAQPNPGELSQLERNLVLTPGQRLGQLVRTVAFIRAGRAAMAENRG